MHRSGQLLRNTTQRIWRWQVLANFLRLSSPRAKTKVIKGSFGPEAIADESVVKIIGIMFIVTSAPTRAFEIDKLNRCTGCYPDFSRSLEVWAFTWGGHWGLYIVQNACETTILLYWTGLHTCNLRPNRNRSAEKRKQTNTATHTNIHNQQHSITHIHWMLAIICTCINILCHPSHLNSEYLIVEVVSKAVENPVALPVNDWN